MNFSHIPYLRPLAEPKSRSLGWEFGARGSSRDLSDPRRGSGSSWRSSREVFFSLRRPREGREAVEGGGGRHNAALHPALLQRGWNLGPGIGKGIFNVTGVAGRKFFSVFHLMYVFPDVVI